MPQGINNFDLFGPIHILAMMASVIIGIVFIIIGVNIKGTDLQTNKKKRNLRLLFILALVLVRGSRYVIDAFLGKFEITDLLSLQICHIDLILLIICLIRPNKVLFNFTFLIGIPMGLSVALMPGRVHAAPGTIRAILFIMSHMMLVMGPIYLAIVEKMVLKLKYLFIAIGFGNLFILTAFILNKINNTNILYIMSAPKGSVIENLSNIFGWPGYIFAMDGIAVTVICVVFFSYKLVVYFNGKLKKI